MKTIINKDNNYSLYNIDNYKVDLITSIEEIIEKFSELIIEYYKFIIEHISLKNSNYTKFIIIRGLDTITNVFYNILFYTKNIDLTFYHCQKSFYFYVEFVGQISEDEKVFLQLTSRDASTYVYKKTIFDINNEIKKKIGNPSDEVKYKINIINTYISIYKTIINKIIDNINIDIEKNSKSIYEFENICNKLNKNIIKQKDQINILNKIIDRLYYDAMDINIFFETIRFLTKKVLKNNKLLENGKQNLNSEFFKENLTSLTSEKFINWLLH
jgi:hypothetical protein